MTDSGKDPHYSPPPRLARALLHRLVKSRPWEIASDLDDLYAFRVQEEGVAAARRRYWHDVLSICVRRRLRGRRSLYQELSYQPARGPLMVRTYLKLAVRNLIKNRLSSFISIAGLALALGCCMVLFAFIEVALFRDRSHEKADQIFLVEHVVEGREGAQTWGDSPAPLGPALQADIRQVERIVRVADRPGALRRGDTVFDERIRFVDEGFLEVFTYPLQAGDKAALSDPNAVILSARLAEKYFGEENPIGQAVSITFNQNRSESFIVRGVAEPFTFAYSFTFDVLAPMAALHSLGVLDFEDWGTMVRATFVEVASPEDIGLIEAQAGRYIALQNAANPDRRVTDLVFDPLKKVSINAFTVRRSISGGSHPAAVILLPTIGLFLLLLACFNYVNIGIASATRRLKEIGVRKAVGSSRFQLVVQFIGENLVLCSLALVLGVALAEYLLLPGLLAVADAPFEMSLSDFFGNTRLWLFFVSMLFITGLGAGAYPALYITRFRAVKIFQGKQKMGGRTPLTRAILSLQFVLSFLTIMLGLTFSQNNAYQRNQDWGYHQDQTLVVPLKNTEQYAVLKGAVDQYPSVASTAGSVHHVGWVTGQAVVEYQAERHDVRRFDVGADYIQTMRLRLREGRSFDPNLQTDLGQAILVNETMAASFGWDDALGQQLRYDGTAYTVVGVVEDFHYTPFEDEIEPVFFRLAPEDAFSYLLVRAEAGTSMRTAELVEAAWKTLYPNTPYTGFFQDTVFDGYFQGLRQPATLFSFGALFAVLLSCMGLYGLVSLNITKRMKELSIRKVLGASLGHITHQINREYLFVLLAAALIAIPLSYVLLSFILDAIFAYHMPLGPFPFVLATGLILVTVVLTVAAQIYKAATANPIHALRNE